MTLYLKRITLQSIRYTAQSEQASQKNAWHLFAPCAEESYQDCLLFNQITALKDRKDQKAALLALKKLIQVAEMGQPLTVHYDEKACHELHSFQYKGKERTVWRIRHGVIRLPFYYGQGKLIFLAGALSKRKNKLSNAELGVIEQEVKKYIDAEDVGELHFEPKT